MKLKRSLPKDRTFEQIKKHYEVEKSIAAKLRQSNKEQRKAIYPVMYDELFSKVTDHPRLIVSKSKEKAETTDKEKLKLVKKFLNDSIVFIEFGPGDCYFAYEVCQYVKKAYAIDISDQRGKNRQAPANFELVVYDGYNLDIENGSADVVFSDQFIEHLHPEDALHHFQLVKRILRDQGVYVIRTPHAYFGPHDISRYFSDEPEGFHLKEWTHSEIQSMLNKLDFSSWHGYWRINNQINKTYIKIPFFYFNIVEAMLKNLAKKPRRYFSRIFLPIKIFMIAVK
jgi:SAM-dependent methyltransferase